MFQLWDSTWSDLFQCRSCFHCSGRHLRRQRAIPFLEHPARMTIADTKSCHKEWKESFVRATVLQSRLALVSIVSGAGAYCATQKKGLPFLVGGGLIATIFPCTLFILKPNQPRSQGLSSCAPLNDAYFVTYYVIMT